MWKNLAQGNPAHHHIHFSTLWFISIKSYHNLACQATPTTHFRVTHTSTHLWTCHFGPLVGKGDMSKKNYESAVFVGFFKLIKTNPFFLPQTWGNIFLLLLWWICQHLWKSKKPTNQSLVSHVIVHVSEGPFSCPLKTSCWKPHPIKLYGYEKLGEKWKNPFPKL